MHFFNPWHDLALANFGANYTPPASAMQMADDLALLPLWYGKGDAVIADGEAQQLFLHDLKVMLPLTAELISYSEIALRTGEPVIPWGWDPRLRKMMLVLGAEEHLLPSMAELEQLRCYASREHAVRILRELQEDESYFCGESIYFTRIENLQAYLATTPGNKVLKMPLSGSGKGLIWILGEITDKQTDWCRRVLREQGGIVAEPILNKVQDFAMEFFLQDGKAHFAGYSLFSSAASGAYTGNQLLADHRIEEILSDFISSVLLHQLRKRLAVKLTVSFPSYTGYAGVDMMICRTDEGYRVQPCVEINMRMNMGMVARSIHDQFMATDGQGRFVVDYFKKSHDALLFQQKMQRESPLSVADGKILSGFLSLTPVTADTRYMAYLEV
jgi:hypothetical protein